MLPLERYRMLDLSRLVPGPFASHLLADMGMEVIKVEEPEPRYGMGRDSLTLPDPTPDQEVRWAAYNSLARNKKSIALNLLDPAKRARSQEIFYRLAREADVILEGYRPGVVRWMGVDYETVSKLNPRIISVSISGYGQSGPYMKYPGHDTQYSALAGAIPLDRTTGAPVSHGMPVSDYSSGMFAAMGVMAALLEREQTGRGQCIDIPMVAASMSFMLGASATRLREQGLGQASPGRGASGLSFLKCKDGKYLTTANSETVFWENFCKVLGKPEFIPLQRARGPEADTMVAEIQAIFLTRDRDDWVKLLRDAETCVAPVNDIAEAMEDPQVRHIGMVWEKEHPVQGTVKQMGFPIRFSRTPAGWRQFAPLLGEHTREILAHNGYTPQEIADLERDGIVKSWEQKTNGSRA